MVYCRSNMWNEMPWCIIFRRWMEDNRCCHSNWFFHFTCLHDVHDYLLYPLFLPSFSLHSWYYEYILILEKRKFPTVLHLNQYIATMLFSISFLIGGRHPDKDVWCADATQSNNATWFAFLFSSSPLPFPPLSSHAHLDLSVPPSLHVLLSKLNSL